MSELSISVVVPCFNEAKNLPVFHARLSAALEGSGVAWELIAVDDHSRDETFAVAQDLARRDPRVRAMRLARNCGSHIAIMCGLDHSRGDAVVMISADLQDPPEVIPQLVERWRNGDQVVWATRAQYEGRTIADKVFSGLHHRMMAAVIGQNYYASQGADFFLVDRVVADALAEIKERNLSLFALLTWLGYRQGTVPYVKEKRATGRSGWTLRKKIKLFIDSVASFSYFPIRAMSALGMIFALLGVLYATFITVNYFIGRPSQGWTSLMAAVLVIGGMQMAMLGILGEYLWRSLDEARRRPRYSIEDRTTGPEAPAPRSRPIGKAKGPTRARARA